MTPSRKEQLSDQPYSAAELEKAVFMAAGLGAACVMKDAPDVVMPTEEIERGCEAILDLAREGKLATA